MSVPRAVALAVATAVLGLGLGLVVGGDRAPGAGSVDVGFLRDMVSHHDQAVQMALSVLDAGADPTVMAFASEVVVFQRYEIGVMSAWLKDWGYDLGDTERQAMRWMDMASPVASMPGMQPEAKVKALAAATGREADRLFLTMLTNHHQGGIQMADYAAKNAGEKKVRDFAANVAKVQRAEIREYGTLRARLGL